jgi:hypothetical protein
MPKGMSTIARDKTEGRFDTKMGFSYSPENVANKAEKKKGER